MLSRLVAIQFLLYAVAWLACGAYLRRERASAWHWAAFMALTCVALYGISMRAEPRTWWPYTGSSVLNCLGYLMLWRGLDLFFGLGRRHLAEQAWAATLMILVFLWLGPAAEHAAGRSALTYAFGGYVLIRAAVGVQAATRASLGVAGWLLVVLPAVLSGTVHTLRATQQLLHMDVPMELHVQSADNDRSLTAYLISAGIFNFSFGALVVMRRVRELHQLSLRDTLTGLFNRRAMQAELEREWQRLQRGGPGFAVLQVDLDHFKAINDGHGHAAGDDVLRHVARRLQESSRAGDFVARMGGEEFLVLMPQTDAAGAGQAAERIRRALKGTLPVGGAEVAMSASIGAAVTRAGEKNWSVVLARADEALYRAKSEGRDRVALA